MTPPKNGTKSGAASRPASAVRVRLALNRDNICAKKRAKYPLGEPKLDAKDIMYVKEILGHLLADAEARSRNSKSLISIC